MKFFVDTNVPVYAGVGEPPYAEACAALVAAVAAGAPGRSSVAVIGELLHLELTGRSGVAPGLVKRALGVFSPLLPVTEEIVREALELDTPQLEANDRIHVATCRANGIDTIVTADAGFDSVPGLTRVDPLDQKGIDALLAS